MSKADQPQPGCSMESPGTISLFEESFCLKTAVPDLAAMIPFASARGSLSMPCPILVSAGAGVYCH